VEEVTLMLGETLTTANAQVFGEYSDIDWAAETLTNRTLSVPCHTLDHLLEYHEAPREFDVLVVDVEGFEDQVFSGFSLSNWRPKMMIIELADTHPDLTVTANSDAKLGQRLTASGYTIVFKDAVNTVFVRDDIWAASFETE